MRDYFDCLHHLNDLFQYLRYRNTNDLFACALRDTFLENDLHDLDDFFEDLRYSHINDLLACALRDSLLEIDLRDLDGLFQDLRYWQSDDGDSLSGSEGFEGWGASFEME